MPVLIQFRRDTAAAWTSANPTLAQGEMGVETNTNLFKIGNGSTAWNSLSYGGLTGIQGIQGTQGTQGIQGIQGIQGLTGTGTVTGVTGTSPVASSGGTAPAISLNTAYGDTLNPYGSKTANFVLAAPNGVSGVPTFRAIVAADIPTLNQNTTGSSGSCTGNAATATTATTATTANALNTANNYQVNSLGVGTGASGTAGEIRATNNITAYFSDGRLKDIKGPIENALDKVKRLSGVEFTQSKFAEKFGYHDYKQQVGVIAQEMEQVLPEIVKIAPFDMDKDGNSKSGDKYLTVQYEKITPLLIEAIKELSNRLEELEQKIGKEK